MAVRRYFAPAKHWSETPLAAVLSPLRGFIEESRSASVLLFAATIIALFLANGPMAQAYTDFLHTEIVVGIGGLQVRHDLVHWINDGLMTIFFIVVGLEIKREFLSGELATPRAAALPVLAAAGGAIVPALIYLALNAGGPGRTGWAVPMATDIAFALGALALLGNRVPITLKIFLTAVAIVDDLIAVLVIAVFYSGQLNMNALGIGVGLLLALLGCNLWGIRSLMVYGVVGLAVWCAFLASGVHATVAGVLVAWTIPARTRIDVATFKQRLAQLVAQLDDPVDDALSEQVDHACISQIERLSEAVQAPLQRAEHSLSQIASLVVIPIFALANAAVPLGAGLASHGSVGWGIVLGLCLGKPIGIMLTCWTAIKIGVADLPRRVSWYQMFGAGVLAGIGFTMSIFVASLAFRDPALLTSAKAYTLVASGISMLAGILILYFSPREQSA
jgi:Na+:H+ antiporter, NhaA family